ncbi:MAG TPA: hypothetical protein VGS10_19185 [Terracidiphilus sp.]|nr:hypothetical protein [Terracidiphilus sp.]HEV2464920.1 hypothetical protein [Acidobacteriaceae bacterium]
MKRTGRHPISLTELVEQLLVVYAGRGTRNAATPSAATVTLAAQQFLDAFTSAENAGSLTSYPFCGLNETTR